MRMLEANVLSCPNVMRCSIYLSGWCKRSYLSAHLSKYSFFSLHLRNISRYTIWQCHWRYFKISEPESRNQDIFTYSLIRTHFMNWEIRFLYCLHIYSISVSLMSLSQCLLSYRLHKLYIFSLSCLSFCSQQLIWA